MSLTYDAQGFIVGIKKSLDEQLQNQKAIKNDTAQIVRLLQGEVVRQQRRLRQSKQSNFNNQNRSTHPKSRQPANGLQNGAMTEQQRATQNHRPTGQALRQSSQTGERLRDKNGRFVGQGGDNSPKGKKDKGELPTLVTSAGNTVLDIVAQKMIADTRNLDPFLDAVGEVQDFVNPITGKLGGLFGKKQKLPKEKERFYKKLHKKLTQIADLLNTPNHRVSGFGRFGKMGKIALAVGVALLSGVAAAFSGLFGKKTDKTQKQIQHQPKKPSTLASAKNSLSPITANVDNALNKSAKHAFGTLTQNLTRQDLPKKLLKLFAFGLNPFFVGASSIFEWIKTQAKTKLGIGNDKEPSANDTPSGGSDVSGAGANNYTGSWQSNKAYKGDTTGGKPNNVAVYEAYRKAGLSHNQALGITAEVGREGNFLNKNIFGVHTDAAKDKHGNSISNMGMLSWNRGRRTQLENYLAKKGLFANGKMVQSQATIDAMAEFSVSEMQGDYKDKLKHFWANPNANPESYKYELGRKYVGWAYGQSVLKGGAKFDWQSHDNRRRGHLNTTMAMVGNGGIVSNSSAQSSPQKPSKIAQPVKVFGDSIANQYGKVHNIKNNYGKDGAAPKQVLEQLQNAIAQGTLKQGDKVVLSTGLSNGMTGNDGIIQEQMALLKKHSIAFDVLGVANNFKDDTLKGMTGNSLLGIFSKEFGGNFLGGFEYNPKDKYKAHPTNDWIKSLKMSAGEKTKKALQSAFSLPTVSQVPATPKVQSQVGTKDKDKTLIVGQNTIGQNVSDDRLAQAITGGIGQRT